MRRLLRMGFLHGMQDAMRAQAATRARRRLRAGAGDALPQPAEQPRASRSTATGPTAARRWAGSHASGTRGADCCALSAGYTSGWLSAMLDADLLAWRWAAAPTTARPCRFVAREASCWADAELRESGLDAIPFDAFRALVRAREARRTAVELAGFGCGPTPRSSSWIARRPASTSGDP